MADPFSAFVLQRNITFFMCCSTFNFHFDATFFQLGSRLGSGLAGAHNGTFDFILFKFPSLISTNTLFHDFCKFTQNQLPDCIFWEWFLKFLSLCWHRNIEMGSFEGKSPHVMRLACTNKKVIYVPAKILVLLSNFQAHNTCRNRRIFWITCSLIQAVMNTNVLRNTSRQASMTSVVEIWGWGVDFCSKSNLEKCICFGLTFNDYT